MKHMNQLTALAIWTTTLILAGTSHAALITFQQGFANDLTGVYTGTEDTYITSVYPSNNYGNNDTARVGVNRSEWGGKAYRELLRFNLGDLPTGSTAMGDATLSIRTTTNPSLTMNVYQILGDSGNWQEDTSTWNHRDNTGAGTAWAGSAGAGTAGTDYAAVALDSASTVPVWVEFTIPQALVQSWIDTPASNGGLLLKLDDETAVPGSDRYVENFTLESSWGSGTLRPKLEVDIVMVPEPSTLVLFLGASSLLLLFGRRPIKPSHE